jgi:serine protease inhibitor
MLNYCFTFALLSISSFCERINAVPPGVQFHPVRGINLDSIATAREFQANSVNNFCAQLIIFLDDFNFSLLFSPLSIHTGLLSVGNGAAADTLSAFQAVLCIPHLLPGESLVDSVGICTHASRAENVLPVYTLSTSLWISSEVDIYQLYMDECKRALDTTCDHLELSNPRFPMIHHPHLFIQSPTPSL